MQFSMLIQATVLVLFAHIAAAVALPIEDHLPVKRGASGAMRFTGSIYPGGPAVDLTGTINDVFPKLIKLYPNLKPVTAPTTSTSPNPSLAKRAFKKNTRCIKESADRADYYTVINHALPYIRAIGNLMCEAPLGWGCASIYCVPSPIANIRLCNGWATPTKVPCIKVWEAAVVVAEKCTAGAKKSIRGQQQSDIGNYTVAITAVPCFL
ncbi:uncharacterized protein DFL_008939 [Arthrobotrys flagrans]|uniref:Uncharacterized protein n=1 Tax=Arthrobotrys flagrans TaxID=97331 RepID=A0A436ZQ79_ARTFL|nr:hypothetical protein DFL_008939 [Arthrobotrys flagrans]